MNNDDKVLEFLYYWDRPISPGNLRTHLDMHHSTLNSVLKRLVEKKYIVWEKYGAIELTPLGKKDAAHLSNHHFIVEKFLNEILNLDKKTAHVEALSLSPHISCVLIDAICDKLGVSHKEINKKFCNERDYY